LSGKGIFAPSEAERKQLEEISHLFFSTPAGSGRTPDPKPGLPPRTEEWAARGPEPFWVCCPAGVSNFSLATGFLFNLALLLRLAQEEVLFLCSDQAMRDRFRFAFRPDRERRVRVGSGPGAMGLAGPMGICLVPRRAWEEESCRAGGEGRGTFPGMASFHYVLADYLPPAAPLESFRGITLLLVTPQTRDHEFQGQKLMERGLDRGHPAPGGIVVAGVPDRDEGATVYTCWKEMLEERMPGRWQWEDFGFWPAPADKAPQGTFPGMEVIESPTGRQTQCCLEIVARVRKKRRELCGLAGENHLREQSAAPAGGGRPEISPGAP